MPLKTKGAAQCFPDFDNLQKLDGLLAALPGSVDVSWERDTSPCISYKSVEIWVDYRAMERREDPIGREIDIWHVGDNIMPQRVYQTDCLLTSIEVIRDFTQIHPNNQGILDTFLPELSSCATSYPLEKNTESKNSGDRR